MHSDNLGHIIEAFLKEDRIAQDITTRSLIPKNIVTEAVIVAQESGVCCGVGVARLIFKILDKKVQFTAVKKDGQSFKKNDVLVKLRGSALKILSAERLTLNILARLSGIATLTNTFVRKSKPHRVRILDTRKTTPGFRILEKFAVRCGGGYNHRLDLSDGVLIKDNHIAIVRRLYRCGLGDMVALAKKKARGKEIEIEVSSIAEFLSALHASPDIIMLDNMSLFEVKQCVRIRNAFDKKIKLEVSGGVTLKTIKKIAAAGVERISIGALTHSARSIDISLEIKKVQIKSRTKR